MRNAPEGELGVVYLFSKLQRQLGFSSIIRLGDSFPDCEALRRTGKGEARPIQIEFEFKSRNFLSHHKKDGLKRVNAIICWEDNWPPERRSLLRKHRVEILELRREVGRAGNIWFHVVTKPYQQDYLQHLRRGPKKGSLPCPKGGKRGDLLLDYIGAPGSYIAGIERLASDAYPARSGRWRYRANTHRVATLAVPVHMTKIKSERSLVGAPFLKRGGLQGYPRVTEYWPQLSALILRLNPKLGRTIRKLTAWE
jgi:hypothetical protein